MPTEFYFEFSTLISTEKLQSHFLTVTETLNSDKSDSNQSYSGPESETAQMFALNSHFNIVHNLNVFQFNHKTYQQSPKISVHVIGLHDVTATVGETSPCKI